ncbi:MAG: transposase domain-containing protein [Burkholderiales bacterium]
MHLSLIRTAKQHGLDPYHYYRALLKNIPHCQSVEDYEKLIRRFRNLKGKSDPFVIVNRLKLLIKEG